MQTSTIFRFLAGCLLVLLALCSTPGGTHADVLAVAESPSTAATVEGADAGHGDDVMTVVSGDQCPPLNHPSAPPYPFACLSLAVLGIFRPPIA